MELSPYGAPPVEIEMKLGERMLDWSGSELDWNLFFTNLITDISNHIWPVWDNTSGWSGSSVGFYKESTHDELLIQSNAGLLDQFLADNPSSTTAGNGLNQRDHFWLYALEDDISVRLSEFAKRHNKRYVPPTREEEKLSKFGFASVAYYDNALSRKKVKSLFGYMFSRKYEGLYQTKLYFRRPRPQQVAFQLGISDFKHHQALWSVHTGNHPSLVSGHCIQGLLLSCCLVDETIKKNGYISDELLEKYRQYAVDVGDRRVFAGVHYISDNIASWISVLRVIPWIFPKNSSLMLEFVARAIRENSAIYNLAKQRFPEYESLSNCWFFLDDELKKVSA